ncbi:hypothetical protein HPB50_013724 [Hyalomma asiaticum]|uniref:Uncharacterized protein n=1 Tax=Hyalomma asiaticum TaxID=266040 RepID=A0ACB7TG23_HYAAI|nr:hypothetical protein HPB50_013724 [Hyalomma asiaticum]
MACSVDSVSAAASGRGVGGCSLPAGYKLLLPTLPSDETMKLCVFLHCDVGGRTYRIEDFRSPLEELGVLKAMSGIGPYQMSHVWMLKLRSQEEKNLLISSGGLKKSRQTMTPPAAQRERHLRRSIWKNDAVKLAVGGFTGPTFGTRPKKTRPKVLTGERESTEIDGGASFELTEQGKEANKLEEACLGASAEMDVDPALLKRRHEEDDGVKERVQRELQPVWKVVTGKKGKYVPRTRAASLTRDARSDE